MIATTLGLWLALIVAGNTPIGRGLYRWLVHWPAERLSRVSRGAVLTWTILGAIGALLFLLLEDEGLRLFTMALPELAGWVTAFEITSLVDALAAVMLAASTVRISALRRWIAARRPVLRRTRRTRRARPTRRADNDDEDPAGLTLAA